MFRYYGHSNVYAADFETTVYKGQKYTEVWAAAIVQLYTEDVNIFHSIDEVYLYLKKLKTRNTLCYFHNLKFDGEFWLSFLMKKEKLDMAGFVTNDGNGFTFYDDDDMHNDSFKFSISSLGQWYNIIIKTNNKYIELRDSLKILPFSVSKIGKSFGTKHKKLDMEYKGLRWAGCTITDEEKKYIANDVLVIKEALEIMYDQGHKKLTIGSCCLAEFKSFYDKQEYQQLFPNLTEYKINEQQYGASNADAYIRKSYRGGWCYLVKGKEGIHTSGCTLDVNSLYPSMMHSESGNLYPVGLPTFWRGDYIPESARVDGRYFFVRLKTRFYIRDNYLPFIQIKNNLCYRGTESLETSDFYDPTTGKYYQQYIGIDGEIHDAKVTLTMTMTDYELFKEHYILTDTEILDGCYFETLGHLFDGYIDKYKKIKIASKGAIRELAKLFLNNLYGKMAASTSSSFKIARLDENGVVKFRDIKEEDKQPGYIAIGSAITSYARNFTIRAAQKNYYGKDKPGFIYADTDSIHCDLSPEEIKGVRLDDVNFCCWKVESCWDIATFVRQKTYIEHVVKEDNEDVTPFYTVKCAGMPENCKNLFLMSMNGYSQSDYEKLDEDEQEFVKVKRSLSDFKIGLVVPGKLLPKHIPGGVVLMPTTYKMR